jgi:hypothetical protein
MTVGQTSDSDDESSSIGPPQATPPAATLLSSGNPDDREADDNRTLSPESALDGVRKRRRERLTQPHAQAQTPPSGDDATPSLLGALRGATSLPPRQWVKWERPERVEKITADDLKARLERWAQSKRAKAAERTPEQNASMMRRAAFGVLFVAAAVLTVAHSVHTNRHEQTVAANQVRIAQLEGDYTDAQPDTEPHRQSQVRAMAQLSAAAAKAGNEVASAQQRFVQLHHQAGQQGDPGNGAPTQATLHATAHRRSLAKYFDPDSLILTDEQAYSWTTAYELEADQIDPRFEWYIRYEGLKPSGPKVYAWSLEAAMPALAAPGAAQVVWVCREAGSQTVLAWATAVYTGPTGRFSDLKVVVTADGAARAQSSTPQAVPELGRQRTPPADRGDEGGGR